MKLTVFLCLYLTYLLFRAKVRAPSDNKGLFLICPPNEYYNYARLCANQLEASKYTPRQTHGHRLNQNSSPGPKLCSNAPPKEQRTNILVRVIPRCEILLLLKGSSN